MNDEEMRVRSAAAWERHCEDAMARGLTPVPELPFRIAWQTGFNEAMDYCSAMLQSGRSMRDLFARPREPEDDA